MTECLVFCIIIEHSLEGSSRTVDGSCRVVSRLSRSLVRTRAACEVIVYAPFELALHFQMPTFQLEALLDL